MNTAIVIITGTIGVIGYHVAIIQMAFMVRDWHRRRVMSRAMDDLRKTFSELNAKCQIMTPEEASALFGEKETVQ